MEKGQVSEAWRQQLRDPRLTQNVRLLVQKFGDGGWDSVNFEDQEGLKMIKDWTGLLLHFAVKEVGYHGILQEGTFTGNYA